MKMVLSPSPGREQLFQRETSKPPADIPYCSLVNVSMLATV